MRFSIRDCLWLTALAAVLVAWWIDRRAAKLKDERHAAQIAALQDEIKAKASIIQVIRMKSAPNPDRQRLPHEWDYQAPPHFDQHQRRTYSLERYSPYPEW